MASIQCPHCGAKLDVPEAALGKKGRCPKCQQKFLVQVPAPLDELSLAPLDEFVPLEASPTLLGDSYSLQPLPPAAVPLCPAMALPARLSRGRLPKDWSVKPDSPSGERGISVATLNITWRLLDPEGKEAWKGTSGGKFDPFTSKYVVVGSRKTNMAPGGLGGGSTQVRLDYKGKDAMTAQLEEILEKYWYPGMPTCLVKNEGGYSALPLAASEEAKQKP